MLSIILIDEFNNTKKKYSFDKNTKIIDLKKMIINDFYQSKGYIDLNILLEKTKRTFGKFNLEPGVMPRTFDNRLFENFGLENDTIKIKVETHTNEEIKLNQTNIKSSNEGKYIPPNRKKLDNNNFKEFVYKEEDFPSLG